MSSIFFSLVRDGNAHVLKISTPIYELYVIHRGQRIKLSTVVISRVE